MTTALPGQLSQGVLIDAPDHILEFGPNPLPPGIAVNGSPITTLQVQVGDGPLTTVTSAIDSGGQFGSIPASLVTGHTVPVGIDGVNLATEVAPGTQISVYTPGGQLLYQFTTTPSESLQVTAGAPSDTNLFITGLTPFLDQPIYIANGPNSGSPGIPPVFAPNVGQTIFDL